MRNETTKHINLQNRTVYFAFLLVGLLVPLLTGDFAMGGCMIALSVLFSPFNLDSHWREMATRHKALFTGHMLVAIVLIAYALFLIVQ